uniref:Uncharacterized protein n=1 Tax=Daphnia galeata TaxID=27404 RepID=A0A8J2WE93_9CRUS|nr:unnamed protein product [Daphnia galeata]
MQPLVIFLFLVIVAVSHQQYHPHIVMVMRPRMSPIISHPDEFRNHLNYRYYGDKLFNPVRWPVFILSPKQFETRADSNRFVQIHPRIKNYLSPDDVIISESDDEEQQERIIQQDPRFLLNILPRKSTATTATFTITSTCTSLTVSTCVPRANFRPVAPAVIPNCRRKRELESDDHQQFSIVPTKVLPVMTTERPILPDSREFSTLIASSKEEDVVLQSDEEQGTGRRKERFLHYFFSNSVASTTITIWSVVSTTLTQTFVPRANFLCIPPGTVICSVAAAGK